MGLTPIAMRQLPYTATKLVTYDMFARAAKGVASTLERTLMPDSDGKRLQPLAIVLAGMLAGAAAAVVSHPADLLLTRLCGSSATTNLAECVIADGVPGGGKSRRGPRHRGAGDGTRRGRTHGRRGGPERAQSVGVCSARRACFAPRRLHRAGQVPVEPRPRRRVLGAGAEAGDDLRDDEHPVHHLRGRAQRTGGGRAAAAQARRHPRLEGAAKQLQHALQSYLRRMWLISSLLSA